MIPRFRRTVVSREMRVPVFFPTKAFTPSEHPQTSGVLVEWAAVTGRRLTAFDDSTSCSQRPDCRVEGVFRRAVSPGSGRWPESSALCVKEGAEEGCFWAQPPLPLPV